MGKNGAREVTQKTVHIFQNITIERRRNKNLGSLHPSKDVAGIIRERLGDIKQDFDIGAAVGAFRETRTLMVKAKRWLMLDSSIERLKRFRSEAWGICTREEILPLEVNSADLCVSFLNMHRINNLNLHLVQINHILKDKGFFLGAFFGGRTLFELQNSLMEGELESRSATGIRVGPFLDLQAAVGMLQEAGFHMCMGDRETFLFYCPTIKDLQGHLKQAGENGLIAKGLPPLNFNSLKQAEEHYKTRFPSPDGSGIRATFEVLFLSGWKN